MNTLTKKEKGFADDYIDTGNGTKSALKNYDTEDISTAGVIAYENLRKPKIQKYLIDNAEGAISRIVELSIGAKNETVKLNANKDIADRGGFKPVDKSQTVNINLTKSIDPTDETILNSLKTIQDKLENE